MDITGDAMAAMSLGLALAGAPGPVQAVLLAESAHGGIRRGLRALAGSALTFGSLLVALSLGLSMAPPSGVALRILRVVGGAFLLRLAVEGLRSERDETGSSAERRSLRPSARGALAVLLNPGAWLFLGTVASPLFVSAGRTGGTAGAFLVALALILGLAAGDFAVVVLGGLGLRRAGEQAARWVRRGLALVLGGLGAWLLVEGLAP